jgi:hypothetical protein
MAAGGVRGHEIVGLVQQQDAPLAGRPLGQAPQQVVEGRVRRQFQHLGEPRLDGRLADREIPAVDARAQGTAPLKGEQQARLAELAPADQEIDGRLAVQDVRILCENAGSRSRCSHRHPSCVRRS